LELALAYDTVERLDQQREEFLSLVSHELRQPAAAVALLAEGLAGAPGLADAQRPALQGLRQQARSLVLLAEDVLAIAQVESGQFQLHPTLFDVGHLVSQLVSESQQSKRVTASVAPEPMVISADPDRIAQAFGNMLRNALKYSKANTNVSVNVYPKDQYAVIEVCDQGIGFEAGDADRLFQKYGRISNGSTKTKAGGVGLGLYLSRLLVEAHGGYVAASSPGTGGGATFTMGLPRVPMPERRLVHDLPAVANSVTVGA
jgi:signal transduction histidine kinase